MPFRHITITLTLLWAGAVPLIAHAEVATPQSTAVPAASTSSRAQTKSVRLAATGGSQGTLQEVVVTAQRREQRQVDVPISVTAVSAEKLATSGVTDMATLAQVVPGMHINSSGSFYQPTIRGVGTAYAGAESNIATYIDGVYEPNPLTNNFDFLDVQSIQVLKGPQGTLFGRNATGGAILVTTLQPSFDSHLKADVGYGSFNTTKATVFGTTGFTDHLAGSIALGYVHSDGWITNVLTGRDANPSYDYLARGKLLFQPNDGWKSILTLVADGENDPSLFAASPWRGYSDAGAFFGVPLISGDDPREVSLDGPIGHKVFTTSGNLRVEGDLGFATLKSITAVEHDRGHEFTNESASAYPAGGTLPVQPCPTLLTCSYLGTGAYAYLENVNWFDTEDTYSQEFDLNHSGGAVDWVGGLYYFNDRFQYNPFNTSLYGPFGPGGALSGALPPWPSSSYVSTGNQHTYTFGATAQSIAAFADATYKLGTLTPVLDKFYFDAGVRWDADRAGVQYQAYSSIATGFTATPYESSYKNYYSWTPRAVIRYAVTPDSSLYVSYSEGTKAGIYNFSGYGAPGGNVPVDPEYVYDVEGGYKVVKPDWQLETSIYHYNYRNLQVETYQGAVAELLNAPSSEIYGLDLHWVGRLTRIFRVDFGFAYTHARYTDFTNAPLQVFSPLYGVVNSTTNVSGGVMERTPEYSGDIGPELDIPLYGGDFVLNASYNYQSRTSFDFADTQQQGGYGLLNVRIGWTSPSGGWTYSVSGRNVTNKPYLVQILPNAGGFGQVFGEPANIMAEVSYSR